jgi:hypothetical protein
MTTSGEPIVITSRFAWANLKLTLGFTRNVLAIPVAYWPLLGSFAWKFFAFKTELDSFHVGAVAYLAELVFSCYTASYSVGAVVALHFWAFLTSDSAHTNLHDKSLRYCEAVNAPLSI